MSLCYIMTGWSKCRENSLTHCQITFGNDCSDESVCIYWIPQHVTEEKPHREQWRE